MALTEGHSIERQRARRGFAGCQKAKAAAVVRVVMILLLVVVAFEPWKPAKCDSMIATATGQRHDLVGAFTT